MQGLFGNLNNTLNNIGLSGNLGLLTTGVGLLEGQPIGQAVQAGLGTYQGLADIEEDRKRKEMIQKLISEGGFTKQEQALIAASNNPAGTAVQIRNQKQARLDAAAARKAAANKPTAAVQQRTTLADQFGLTGVVRRNYILTGNLPKEGESDDKTALIKNFEFYKNIKPDASDEEIIQYLKGGNTFNLGPDVQIKGDYAITKDPSAPNGIRYTVIPGSLTDQKQQAAAQKESKIESAEQARTEAEATSGTLVLEEIDRAIALIEENPILTTGIGAQISKSIFKGAGTPAVNLEQIIAPIQANIGFDRLGRMREESPTGGALGQVAVKELEFLQAVRGSLSQLQSAPQLLENLKRLSKEYKASMLRIYRASEKDQQDGVINTVTGKVINPLDYFSQGEIDMLTKTDSKSTTQTPSGSILSQIEAATSIAEIEKIFNENRQKLTDEDRAKVIKKMRELGLLKEVE